MVGKATRLLGEEESGAWEKRSSRRRQEAGRTALHPEPRHLNPNSLFFPVSN